MGYRRMSSSKNGRCRVRDIVSCFYPRLISPEEQHLPKTWKNEKRCGEDGEAEEDYIVFCFGEGGEIHMINSSESQPCIRRRKENRSKIDSFESCDSNPSESDTSTSSFAFPVLRMEWIGSPVHMPSTQKKACLCRLHCRF